MPPKSSRLTQLAITTAPVVFVLLWSTGFIGARYGLPYIEPLNLLQVELLRRYRAGETDARVREGIQLSINAVATALRNSG